MHSIGKRGIILYAGRVGRFWLQSPSSTTISPAQPQREPSRRIPRHRASTPRHTAPAWGGGAASSHNGGSSTTTARQSLLPCVHTPFLGVVRQMCATAFLLITFCCYFLRLCPYFANCKTIFVSMCIPLFSRYIINVPITAAAIVQYPKG